MPLFGVGLAGCDDGIPDRIGYIPVTGLTLDETLAAGLLMEIGQQPVDITGKVSHTPANANDIAEAYTSSNPAVVSVSGDGKLSANTEGTATITITVGNDGMDVTFPVEVVNKIPIPATNLELMISRIDVMQSQRFNLGAQVILTPSNSNDEIVYSDYDNTIVSIDANGMVRGLSEGTTSIKVSSGRTPSLSTSIPVSVVPFSGYYPRNLTEDPEIKPWSLKASQNPLPNITDCGQGLLAPFDGEPGPGITCLALAKPGKTSGDVAIPENGHIWFVIDMQKPLVVNRLKVSHRVDNPQVRPWGFDLISGSNDGENFTPIATNALFPTGYPNEVIANDVANVANLDSEVSFSNTVAYRYIRFYAETAQCFYQKRKDPNSSGGAVQFREINLGYFAQ